MYLHTNNPIVSPVLNGELADFGRFDSDDPMLTMLLLTATQAAISYLKQDILTRTWVLKYQNWPIIGTATNPSISRSLHSYKSAVALPMTNLISVDSVKIDDAVVTDYTIVDGKPCALLFDIIGTKLEVEYKAGYGTSATDVPEPIRNAIMMIATYIRAHIGGCDAGEAIKGSGAASLLAPYAVNAGIVL